MSRIEQIGQLIESNLTDEILIIPEKHREVEHALKKGLQSVGLKSIYTDTSVVYEVEIPEGSVWDTLDFNDSKILFNVIVQNNRTGQAKEVSKSFSMPTLEGGAKVAAVFPKLDFENINLNSVRISKAGKLENSLI